MAVFFISKLKPTADNGKPNPLLSFLANHDLCGVLAVEKPLRSKAEGGEGWNALEAAPGGRRGVAFRDGFQLCLCPAASIS